MCHKRPILRCMITHRSSSRCRWAIVGRRSSPPRTAPASTSAPALLAASHRCPCRRALVCWRMALPLSPPLLPQLARPAQEAARRATAGSTSPSGTDSARSPSSTARTSTCSRATASRCAATSPSSTFPDGPLRARRRDRALRRRGPAGLRRARPAHPPRRVAHQHARRADADALHRLRPARATTTSRCSSCPQRERRDRLEAARRRARSTSRPSHRGPRRGRSRGCRAPRA